MKKPIILIVILLFSVLKAQSGIRVGFRGGYSMATQYGVTPKDNPYEVNSFYRHGYIGGLLVNFPINDNFSIQQEFVLLTKGSRQDIKLIDQPVETHVEYDLNYFEIPLVLKYNILKIGEVKLYGTAGYAMSILLSGKYRIKGSVTIVNDKVTFKEKDRIEGIDVFDYAFLYGSGIDFNLYDMDWFLEYRFTIGWNTILMPTYEGEDPAPLRNQDYIFTLGVYLQ